ncbi:MAG: SGNH/GDSL hydrolase family protein [Nitrococcus mobilis]|nr:SGNH/GDSL hydrolase family protein [Nitrococcus mobilis]
MKKKIVCIALLLCSFISAAALGSPVYGRLVVFGDSLSDTGNNAVLFDRFFGGARTSVPLTPPDLVPSPPYQTNRYSNGPVWAEPFADALGLSAQASRLGGTNYAHGGARVGSTGTTLPPSLLSQVDQFLADFGGQAPADSLYVIEGGGDDARDALAAVAAAGDPGAAGPIIGDFGVDIASIVTDLYTAGASNFLIWNVPDLGVAPAVQALGQNAIAVGTAIARTMNDLLAAALTPLDPLPIDLFQFDAFGFTQALASNPQAFGFADASVPCAVSAACINAPAGFFFWDGIHPTTAGHEAIAQAALQVLPRAVSEPGSLCLMVFGLLGIGWFAAGARGAFRRYWTSYGVDAHRVIGLSK